VEIIAMSAICQNVPLHCLKECKEGWEGRNKTESTLERVAWACRERFHTLTLQGPRSQHASVSQGHVTSPTHSLQSPSDKTGWRDRTYSSYFLFNSSLSFLPLLASCRSFGPLLEAFASTRSAFDIRCQSVRVRELYKTIL